MTAPASPVAPRRAALAFIFITLLLDILALGMIIPVLPRIVASFVQEDPGQAARVFGLFGTAWALMQLIFSPVLGALSDRYGRRKVILLSNVGLGLDSVLMALAPSLGWLFVGRILSGITAASISTASAYIADVTPPEKRAASYGLIGAAFGVGFVLGPALGGLLGAHHLRLPFWVAAGLSLTNALYGLFVLPESLPPERRSATFRWRTANPLGALNLLRSRPQVSGLAGVHFLHNLAHMALPNVFVLHAGYRFGWDERMVGLAMAGSGLCSLVVQGGLVRYAVKRLGERRTLLLGLSCGALGFAIYALAPTEELFLGLGIPVMALWGLSGPAVQAIMSTRISASEQGQFPGALTSLVSLGGLVGPSLFTQLFAVSIAATGVWHLPGAPYLLSAVLLTGALTLAVRVTRAPREETAVPVAIPPPA